MNNKVVIYGCGGHGRSVANCILENCDMHEILFIDENVSKDETILSFPCQKNYTYTGNESTILAIGDNDRRKAKFDFLIKNGVEIEKVISDKAYIGRNVHVDRGSVIMPYAFLGPEVVVGEDTIINTHAIIEHEVKIGKHSHVSSGAIVCGRCAIGDEVFVGAGSTIIDKVEICDGVKIGAGSTVIKSITTPGTYIGTPARMLRKD